MIKNNNNNSSNAQSKGTMSKNKLARFKLTGNFDKPELTASYNASRNITAIARSARMIHTYRQFVHKCNERKLPASLKQTIHYFMNQLTRIDSGGNGQKETYAELEKVETETLT